MKRLFALASILTIFCVSFAVRAQTPVDTDPMLTEAKLSRVSPHVWVLKGFPNVGIVVGRHATLVIDTGMGPQNGATVARIALKLSPPGHKLYLTTTHFHAEHASGDAGFPTGTVLIRPRVQQTELEADGERVMNLFRRNPVMKPLLENVQIKPADVLFDDHYRLDLGGGVRVRLYWFGTAHTKGDEIVMIDPDSVMFPGDVVQNQVSPNVFCDVCSPRLWLTVLDRVAPLRPRLIVPDHGAQGGTALIAKERNFLTDLQTRAMALKAEGKSADEAGKIVAAEFQAKYAGWYGLNNVPQSVQRAYADPE